MNKIVVAAILFLNALNGVGLEAGQTRAMDGDHQMARGLNCRAGPSGRRVLGWILVFLLRCGYRVRERATMCC